MGASKGTDLHERAEVEREKGNFLDSLKLSDEAMIAYQEEGNLAKFAEIQASRFITFKHLYRSTHFQGYLSLAICSGQNAVELAKLTGNKSDLVIPLFNLAKALQESQKHEEAVPVFKETVEIFETVGPDPEHNRPQVLADIKGHLAYSEYQNGDKTALERAEEALKEIEEADESLMQGRQVWEKRVWETGAHGRIAMMVKDDNPELAKKHYLRAKEIIDSDPELVLRKEQLGDLAKALNLDSGS